MYTYYVYNSYLPTILRWLSMCVHISNIKCAENIINCEDKSEKITIFIQYTNLSDTHREKER